MGLAVAIATAPSYIMCPFLYKEEVGMTFFMCPCSTTSTCLFTFVHFVPMKNHLADYPSPANDPMGSLRPPEGFAFFTPLPCPTPLEKAQSSEQRPSLSRRGLYTFAVGRRLAPHLCPHAWDRFPISVQRCAKHPLNYPHQAGAPVLQSGGALLLHVCRSSSSATWFVSTCLGSVPHDCAHDEPPKRAML